MIGNLLSRLSIIAICVFALANMAAASVFSTNGREILLDGQPFEVRGICYSPSAIGKSGSAPPYGDYFTAEYQELWDRDFPLLRQMGTNVIRHYGWTNGADHSAFLNAAYNNGNQPLFVLLNRWINPDTDWTNTSAVNALIAEWEAFADEVKDSPAVMGFLIGNETNAYSGNGYNPAFWTAMNQIAGAVKAVAPNKLVSIAIIDTLDQVETNDAAMTNFDFWAIQVYRGESFGSFFTDYAARSPKPIIITEYGYDAYDARIGGEYADDASLPAAAMENLLRELRENRAIAAGGCIFEYADEWWKSGTPNIQDAPTGWQGPFADNEANEEWWGIFRILDNGSAPDILQPRAMFYRVAAMWNSPFATNLSSELVDGKLRISFDYPSYLRDQRISLQASSDTTNWSSLGDNASSTYLASNAPSLEASSSDQGGMVSVVASYDLESSANLGGGNLLINGDFESGTTNGWSTWGTATSTQADVSNFSLQLPGAGGFTVPSAFQQLSASPGDEFRLSGYMLTETALPADATAGLLKIVFKDAENNDLQPAEVSVGMQAADAAFPGAESLPVLNSESPAGTWILSETQAIAPEGTASVSFFLIHIDQSPGTIFFDSIEVVDPNAETSLDPTRIFIKLDNDGL